MKKFFRKMLNSMGYEVVKKAASGNPGEVAVDMEPAFREIWEKCRTYTMTSPERMYGLYKAVEYLVRNKIPGDIVECGVWRGGSSMAVALSLIQLGDTSRKIYLYDTYEGMSAPTEKDKSFKGEDAGTLMDKSDRKESDGRNIWCFADLDDVQRNMKSTGYPGQQITYIKGKVEDTLPSNLPGPVALLRLDTDFYESTLCEMKYLWPLLVNDGVLIVDDYGHWQGAREAIDQYLLENRVNLLLNRLDYTGRIAVKN